MDDLALVEAVDRDLINSLEAATGRRVTEPLA
jgi:hypothetical protein